MDWKLCREQKANSTNSMFFQVKGLRKILGIPPTHIDRTWTNDKVLYKANKDAGVDFPLLVSRNIIKVTYTIKKKRLLLLGHIIITDNNDPIKQVTFANND